MHIWCKGTLFFGHTQKKLLYLNKIAQNLKKVAYTIVYVIFFSYLCSVHCVGHTCTKHYVFFNYLIINLFFYGKQKTCLHFW